MKPGIRSTEFWLGLIGVILAYFNESLGLDIPVPAIVSVLGLIAVYIFGRSYVKGKNSK